MSASGTSAGLTGTAAGGRRLIAVVYADMAGYSRLIGLDDSGTLRRLRTLRRALIDPTIRKHGGRIVQTGGDSLLVTFDSIDAAVRCSVRIQRQVPVYDGDQPPERRIRFRVGIDIGDAIPHGTDLHGEAVNIAARLQAECPVGGICISRSVRDHVHGRLELHFEPIGELTLKNIGRPVEAFVLRSDPAGLPRRRFAKTWVALAAVALLLAGAWAGWWLPRDGWDSPMPAIAESELGGKPRLSIVVLPFENLTGDAKDDYLADAITDDLTSDLSHVAGAFVIARSSAYTYRGKAVDVKRLGNELVVRYALSGSVRKLSGKLRVNAQLISTETGRQLWADRFDEAIDSVGTGQDEIVSRVGRVLGVRMVDIESTRSARERPNNPDEFDLILRARSLRNGSRNQQRNQQALTLYEQALAVNRESVPAMLGIAGILIDRNFAPMSQWSAADDAVRAANLVAAAQALQPDSEDARVTAAELAQMQERWRDLEIAAQRLIELYPNRVEGYELLGMAKRFTATAEETVPLYEKSLRLNPLESNLSHRCSCMAYALLLTGRYQESIIWFQRSLAANPQAPAAARAGRNRSIAAAYALLGNVAAAQEMRREADRLYPYVTARTFFPDNPSNAAQVAQMERIIAGLQLAGVQDHAEEDADYGVAADEALRRDLSGPTPLTTPGAQTIRTLDLSRLLEIQRPIVIDAMLYSWGRSLPGAIGLRNVGLGGSLDDTLQARLRRKMEILANGDLTVPVVAVGWDSLRFDGRNLALRLVALGFTKVYWYRGGREAWEVAGLQETELKVLDW